MKENQHTEWKEKWQDEYLKWICGFANSKGGVLVIGRNDKGAVVGVANAAKLLQEIPNKVRDMRTGLWAKLEFPTPGGNRLVKISEKKFGEKFGEKLGETRLKIIKFMQADTKISQVELAERLNISTTAVEKNIEYLRTHGFVRRTGPAKGGRWEVLK